MAAVSLYQLLQRQGTSLRFGTRDAACDWFAIDRSTPLFITGTGEDTPIERWWSLGSGRLEILGALASWKIAGITAPNFSIIADVPRWDNFHAMKRIAICWQEMSDAGLPVALHVNARAHRDWARWADFIKSRPEVSAVAYEFATGAVSPIRMAYHVEELRHLADTVNRPLRLVVRGALNALAELQQSFARVTILEPTSYMKTVNRKIAVVRENGRLDWEDAPGRPNVNLSELYDHNHLSMVSIVAARLRASA